MSASATKVVTDPSEKIRASYVNIFQPRMNDLNGKEEYSVMLLIPKSAKNTLKSINRACKAAIEKKWKGKPPANLRMPLRDGDEPDDDGNKRAPEYLGHYFMNVRGDRAPGIVDQKRNALVNSTELVSGDYVRVSLNAFGYAQKGNKGVSLGLNNVQLVSKGEPLGNFTRAEDDFDELEDDDDLMDGLMENDDVFSDEDDDIPF